MWLKTTCQTAQIQLPRHSILSWHQHLLSDTSFKKAEGSDSLPNVPGPSLETFPHACFLASLRKGSSQRHAGGGLNMQGEGEDS